MKNKKPLILAVFGLAMIMGVLIYEAIGPQVQNFISAMQIGNIGSITNNIPHFQP